MGTDYQKNKHEIVKLYWEMITFWAKFITEKTNHQPIYFIPVERENKTGADKNEDI